VLIRTPMRLFLVGAGTVALTMAIASSRADAAPVGQPKAPQITGEVLDREGGAAAGVTIIARDSGRARQSFRTITDDTGHFRLDGLPAGTYWFIALDAGSTGTSPALPVSSGHLDVVLRLDDEPVRA
jgi:hypothetical protein